MLLEQSRPRFVSQAHMLINQDLLNASNVLTDLNVNRRKPGFLQYVHLECIDLSSKVMCASLAQEVLSVLKEEQEICLSVLSVHQEEFAILKVCITFLKLSLALMVKCAPLAQE